MLLPLDYGKMVIPSIIIGLSTLLVDSGLKSSLIQKQSLNSSHHSTVFFSNIIFGFILGIIIIAISFIFENREIRRLIVLSTPIIIISSTTIVNEARLQIKAKFSNLVYSEFIAYVLAYIIAIILAKNKFGVYCLIAFSFFCSFFYSMILFFEEQFIPKIREFSIVKFLYHWKMGRPLLATGLLESTVEKFDEFILSSNVNPSKLGIFSKGKELTSIVSVIGSKLFSRPWFSLMSKHSSNYNYFKSKYLPAYNLLLIFGTFVITSYFLVGDYLVKLFLGENWIELINVLPLFLISTALYYVIVFNKYSILAIGLPNYNLKTEILFSILKISLLLSIFLFWSKSIFILYFLISIDIFSKIIVLSYQHLILGKLFNENMVTTFLLSFGVVLVGLFSFFNYYFLFTFSASLLLLLSILNLYQYNFFSFKNKHENN